MGDNRIYWSMLYVYFMYIFGDVFVMILNVFYVYFVCILCVFMFFFLSIQNTSSFNAFIGLCDLRVFYV